MNLSNAQLLILKASIATSEFSALPHTADNAFTIAAAYNLPAAPAVVVWRESVLVSEIEQNGFLWNTVDSMTVGKARIWEWMRGGGVIHPNKTNVRQGLVDAFGAASAQAVAIAPHLKRNATRMEALFAVGTGTDVSPSTLPAGFTDNNLLNYFDILNAWNAV